MRQSARTSVSHSCYCRCSEPCSGPLSRPSLVDFRVASGAPEVLEGLNGRHYTRASESAARLNAARRHTMYRRNLKPNPIESEPHEYGPISMGLRFRQMYRTGGIHTCVRKCRLEKNKSIPAECMHVDVIASCYTCLLLRSQMVVCCL